MKADIRLVLLGLILCAAFPELIEFAEWLREVAK
jgi:hypothetical protein